MAVRAEDYLRRSWLHRRLADLGAELTEIGDGAVPLHYGGGLAAELAAARELGLAELSLLPRLGCKGRMTLPRLNGEGVRLVDQPNRAVRQPDGGLAAILAPTEVLLLAPLSGEAPLQAKLAAEWRLEQADGMYLVPRQDSHFWFALTGRQAAAMFAKLCGVDLRPDQCPDLTIAQTSVARANAIVIRADLGATLAYHLLGDSASAGYFWDCLVDAMAEFGGQPVGLAALRALADG